MAKSKSFPQVVRELEGQFTAVFEQLKQHADSGIAIVEFKIAQVHNMWHVEVWVERKSLTGDRKTEVWVRSRLSLLDAIIQIRHDLAGTEPPPF